MRIPSPTALPRTFARIPNAVFLAIELLALSFVLALAWKARSVWPAVPLADPDTWGYLNPALGWLGGLGFHQAGGRDWLYPALVTLFLKTTGSFAGIAAWQKFLGLSSGILMAVTWRCWVSILPFPRGALFFLSLVGAVPISIQLANQDGIFYEMSTRPEAVLPVFVYAQLACVIGYARFRWQYPRALPSLLLGAAALVLAYACYLLKPSWYLATATTSVPILAGVFGRSLPLKTRLLTPALGAALALLLLWLPARMLFVRDGASVTLLPLALFYVHAQLIEESFDAKLAVLADADPEKARLQHLNDVLKSETRSSMDDRPYPYLGINPDYLLDSRPMNKALFNCAGHDIESIKAFCFRSYRDAVLHDPAAYAKKVYIQFTYFLFPGPKTFFKDRIDFTREYQWAAKSMTAHRLPFYPPAVSEMERRYEEELAGQIAAARPPYKPKRNSITKFLTRWAPPVELLTVLFLFALSATHVWPFLHKLRLGGWAAFFLFLAPFGNAFGICIVHALDIDRYRSTFGGYLLFALTAMSAFIVVVLALALLHTGAKLISRSPQNTHSSAS